MAAARAQVPTISVTPHSPGVLDDSLQQLRRLHAAVQRMRAAPLPLIGSGSSRLSTSCPSLSKDGTQEAECSSPIHLDLYPSRKGSGESRQWCWETGEGRRSSWAALEPAAPEHTPRERSALNGHSASLSSMESEGEVTRTARHSAHSLNDTELAKDFEKVTSALRGAGVSNTVSGPGGNGLGARLPLQKSVSTPSIVAAVQPPVQTCQNIAAFDHHSEKRRKRGSLFFRKKKDKSRKAAHCWAAATVGTDCDWCSRPLDDKPALYCESCTMTVHQNVCKDYITECNKPKSSKTSVGKSLSANSGKSSKRSSVSSQSHSNSKKNSGCYSPWRRVATKLGVHTSHLLNDDKDASDHKHDQSNASDDSGLSEWPEANLTADMLGDEATALGLGAAEPDTWAAGAPKGLAKSLGERETKRQEHIYELILTEKHHCLTIRLMQKMFAEGLIRACNVPPARVARMFPVAEELWRVHSSLLGRLRARQKQSPRIHSVADILADTFACRPPLARIYGEFCARHRDAVEVFKECCAREPRVARFIRRAQHNPLLRKKGVPECVLFVAQRLTKYPLLLEPLLKTATDERERVLLQQALHGVKDILVDVDNQVAAKEREDRKLEIYHRIDAKSFAHYRGRKFKKSDILQGNRSLKFEGVATLMQGRSKMQTLLVIVLTDVLFFLHDNNNKYTFFTPDNKTGVVSLCRLLVREKAGAEGRGLYVICSHASPEMFELRLHRPKDTRVWITSIRAAVAECPETTEECEASALASAEERQRQLEARHENIRLITEALRAKDREHASILEEKMGLHMKLVAHTGTTNLDIPNTGVSTVFPGGLQFPDYVRVSAPSPDTHALWQQLCNVVTDALETSSIYWGGGGSLGRSTSSAGEKHSSQYVNIALPKRADTFAGFDAKRVNHRTSSETGDPEPETTENNNAATEQEKPFYEQNGEAALKLQHAIYTLTCIAWQQLTTIHSLQAQVCAWRSCGNNALASRIHDTQLEELRAAQAKLTADRAHWETQRQSALHDLGQEREQVEAARQELAEQQKDLAEQRDRLYRRLQMLHTQGGSQEEIASVGTLSPDSSTSDNVRRKETKWRSNRGSTGSESGTVPPPQLLSARNEVKAAARAQPYSMVKQQLPLKLASGKSTAVPHGYHRLHESPNDAPLVISHSRAGSSPAPLPTQPPPSNKATRTNTYPKLPEKFRVRSPEPPNPTSHSQQPQIPTNTSTTQNTPAEEEVIYF